MRAAVILLVALAALPALANDAYQIGPGDVVDVQVWREPDLSGQHEVDEEGLLRHSLAGELAVKGLTCDEVADELRRRLERDYLREARVTVDLVTSERRKAWVLGPVARPGPYPVADDTRLLDLLFAAGGLGVEAGGVATLSRMGEPAPGESGAAPPKREPLEETTVDLAALLRGDLSANRIVEAGDVLVVRGRDVAAVPAERRIRVVGEVERPGAYPIGEAPTALDAVLAAGGFTEYASKNRVRLVREEDGERSVQRLRMGDVVEGEGEDNVALQGGDLLVVPESIF